MSEMSVLVSADRGVRTARRHDAVARPCVEHRYLPAVDGLRALAVVAVMTFHLSGALLPGGFTGVDIFFVISGFVVTTSVLDENATAFALTAKAFYARRVARIYPALALCVLVTTLAYILFIPRAWLSNQIPHTGVAALFGLSNLVLALHPNDYFSPQATFNPFTHTWTLGVEEQFYLLLPLLMIITHLAKARGVQGRHVLLWSVGLLSAASLAVCAAWTSSQARWAFYLLPARYWELGAGMLLAVTAPHWRARLAGSPASVLALSLLALALVTVAFLQPQGAGFPFPLALPPVLGAAGLIVCATARPQAVPVSLLGAAPVAFVGRLSYSLYLWHWPVYVLMRWTCGLGAPLTECAAVCLTVLLALFSYVFVEQPLRRLPARLKLPSEWVLATGAVSLVAMVALALVAFKHQGALTLSRTRELAVWYPDPETVAPPNTRCRIQATTRTLGPDEIQSWTPQGCGAAAGAGRLVVVGDSHAGAYARLLRRYAYETGRPVVIYSLPGCPFLGFRAAVDYDPSCAPVERAAAADLATTLKPQDVVFLPSLRMSRLTNEWGGPDTLQGRSAAEDRMASEPGAAALLRQVVGRSASVVFEGPTPMFKSPPFRCADWFNASNPICRGGLATSREDLERRRAPVLQTMRELSERNPSIHIWDPFPILCPGVTCTAFRGSTPLFFDGDHLSGAGNDLLYPSFRDSFKAVFAKVSTQA